MRALLLLTLCVYVMLASPMISAETNIVNVVSAQDELQELLHTESVVIDSLKSYVERLEQKIAHIKRKATEFKAIHTVAVDDVDKFVNNPLNSLTILKRFTDDWDVLMAYAANDELTDAVVNNYTGIREHLKFPQEEDYDEAVGNLLRIQDIYNLEPQRLALGEVNGIKVGSEMSWSDCLEIGKEWNKNGDYIMAKFWMETALSKLPPNSTDTKENPNEQLQKDAKFKILQAMLNSEYQLGNLDEAKQIVDMLHTMKPSHKGVIKDKEVILKALKTKASTPKKAKKANKTKNKSSEQLLIEEICRLPATSLAVEKPSLRCHLETNNLREFLLAPLQVEVLSDEPFIAIHHNVVAPQKIDELKEFVLEGETELSFTGIGKKRMTSLTMQKFVSLLGHAAGLFDEWEVERWNYESIMNYDLQILGSDSRMQAHALFNLQKPKLGGEVVFPQLELKVDLPPNSLLYWTNLNEFHEPDYRSKLYMCPIIAGSQTTVFTGIRQV